MDDLCNICSEPCSVVPWVHVACHEAIVAERDALRATLNAALDALKAAPKPPWNFRPTIGWQGDYCDWYEAQEATREEPCSTSA